MLIVLIGVKGVQRIVSEHNLIWTWRKEKKSLSEYHLSLRHFMGQKNAGGSRMKIRFTETVIEADARELRESNTLAGNFASLLSRCFQSTEPFDDEDTEETQGEQE